MKEVDKSLILLGLDIMVIDRISAVFTTDLDIDLMYIHTLNWLDRKSPERFLEFKPKISYIIGNTSPNNFIDFKIINNDQPHLGHNYQQYGRISFSKDGTITEVKIDIPTPSSVWITYPDFLHDYLYTISEGIIGKLSIDEIEKIFPRGTINRIINQELVFLTLNSVLLLIPSYLGIRSIDLGHIWIGFIIASTFTLIWFYLILKTITRLRKLHLMSRKYLRSNPIYNSIS